MMYEVKEFIGNYNKAEFYSIMGRFFSERIYRKKLPYLINDRDKSWYLFFLKKELVGFCGIKIGNHCTTFSDIYLVEKYNNMEHLKNIIQYMFNLYKAGNIKLLSCHQDELKILKQLGFQKIGSKGSYSCMLWESNYEN